jgi:flagellin
MWSWSSSRSPSVIDDVDHERVIVGGVSGTAFINVALNGAQTISDTLNSIKAKVVQAQDPTQDYNAIQNDITAFINQIDSLAAASQFNGANLLSGGANSQNVRPRP